MQTTTFFLLFLSKFLYLLGNEQTNDLLNGRERHSEDISGTYSRGFLDKLLIQKQNLQKLQSQVGTDGQTWVAGDYKTSLPVYEVCLAFLKEFGQNSADFIKCSVQKARPFRFCESCVKEYKRAITTFEDILQDDEKWSSCRDVLLKADRIQVLDTVYNNIKLVWQDAYCDGCFVSGSISEDENGTVTYEYSDIAKRFNSLFINTTKCIKKYSNISVYGDLSLLELEDFDSAGQNACIACLDVYQDINSEFKDAMKKTNQEVCMDLVDMMNYTRITWGLKLKCTKHHTTNAIIIIITLAVAGTTVAFYVVTGVKGSRKDKKLMIQKRMSVRSAAALYGTTELHQDGLDTNGDGLSPQRNVH